MATSAIKFLLCVNRFPDHSLAQPTQYSTGAMGKIFRSVSRWIFSGFILGAALMVFNKISGQFLEELLANIGLNGAAFVAPFLKVVQHTWFKIFAFVFAGFSAGVLAHHYATIYDRSRRLDLKIAGVKLSELERSLAEIETQIWASPPQFELGALERVVNQCRSLELTLNGFGLDTPQLSYEVDPVGYIERMRRYASRLAPLIEEGHKWHAIEVSRDLSGVLRQEAP